MSDVIIPMPEEGRFVGDLFVSLEHCPGGWRPFLVSVAYWGWHYDYATKKEELTWLEHGSGSDTWTGFRAQHETWFKSLEKAAKFVTKARAHADAQVIMKSHHASLVEQRVRLA